MILSGELSLEQLSNLAQDPEPKSGKQEFLENYINRIIG
jgi:xylose isomerase